MKPILIVSRILIVVGMCGTIYFQCKRRRIVMAQLCIEAYGVDACGKEIRRATEGK